MVAINHILRNVGKPGLRDPEGQHEINGVASLENAGPNDMAFTNEPTSTMRWKAGLVLNKKDFAIVAWRFFPPKAAKLTISSSALIHPTAIIGKEGFGWVDGVHFPHYAGVTIKDEVSIGAYTVIDRGVFEDTFIGENTHLDNLIHCAHNVKIGKRCLIVAGTVLGGSCEIGNDCFIGMGALIRDHIKIGNNVTVGMGATVLSDIPDGEVWAGNPAKKLK